MIVHAFNAWAADLASLAGNPSFPAGYGTAPPLLSAAGAGAVAGTYVVTITTGGVLGTALFSWSVGGVVQAAGVATGASVALGPSGITLSFSPGTYATDNVYTTIVVGVVSTALGAVHLASNTLPVPRIIWVPTTSTYGPSENNGLRPRALRTRVPMIEAHVWGPDFGTTELLADQAVASLHRTGHGAYQVLDGLWSSENGSDTANFGSLYAFRFTTKIPVTDSPIQTVTVTSETTTAVIALPSGDVTAATQ